MRWSFRLGRLAGVDVFVHGTFLLLLAWIAITHWLASRSIPDTALGVAVIVALFGCVLLHELGHAVAAARYGIATRDIILLPIGGLARLERMPDKPSQELVVALAGPAVNLVIAGALWLWLGATGGLPEASAAAESVSMAEGSIAVRLMYANVFILLFNLLPAFPMDGGRVLRALLAMRAGIVRATRIAATVGRALALAFGLFGLVIGNPLLVLIALFVWVGAGQEALVTRTRSALDEIVLADIVERDVPVLSPEDPLEQAIHSTLQSAHKDFPVVADGRVVGILTQRALLTALADPGPRPPVGQVMAPEFASAEIGEAALQAFGRLQASGVRCLPITEEGRLVGVVTLDNVAELMAIHNALTAARR